MQQMIKQLLMHVAQLNGLQCFKFKSCHETEIADTSMPSQQPSIRTWSKTDSVRLTTPSPTTCQFAAGEAVVWGVASQLEPQAHTHPPATFLGPALRHMVFQL